MKTLLPVVTKSMLSLIDVTIDNEMSDKRILAMLHHTRAPLHWETRQFSTNE
jgi:hypothetical protein